MLIAPGVERELGILPHHAALLTALKAGRDAHQAGWSGGRLFIAGPASWKCTTTPSPC